MQTMNEDLNEDYTDEIIYQSTLASFPKKNPIRLMDSTIYIIFRIS